MEEEQVIVYAPQWNNMIVDDVLSENYSSTKQVNLIQQLLAYCIIIGTEVDIGEITYSDLDVKFGSLPGILSNSNFTKDPSKVPNIELMAHMIAVNNQKDSVSPLQFSKKKNKVKSQTGTTNDPKDSRGNDQPADKGLPSTASNEGTAKTTPRLEGPFRDKDSGGNKHPLIWNQSTPLLLVLQDLVLNVRAFLLSDDEAQESEKDILGAAEEDHWEKHKEAAVHCANLKASIDEYYDENIAHRDHTDKLVEASMNYLDKSSTTISDLYKGLNIITKLLKEINNAVKDDLAINKKISEATKTFTKISTNITEAHALKQEELAAWAKSSTNMAWNLGSRLLVFKGQSSSAPSGSVTLKLALTYIRANVEGEYETNIATEDPPSHSEVETDANKQEKLEEPKHSTDANIEFIGSSTPQPSVTQAQPITIINPEPIFPQREGKGIATDE
ncbi:hypothetical protein Tco_0659713 [Tanacetum coccineum]